MQESIHQSALTRLVSTVRAEAALVAGAITTALFLVFGTAWLADLSNAWLGAIYFLWLFAVMFWCAFNVVRHADRLAELLGEPYGTLILTISVIAIEVALISAIMLQGDQNPSLARDTMLSVIMIVLNAMVGVGLLIGGFRHGEQSFNLSGARTYLSVLVPLATISLILPRFTTSTAEPTLNTFQAVAFSITTIVLYGAFLAIQTIRHRGLFVQPGESTESNHEVGHEHGRHAGPPAVSITYHAFFLVLTMLPIVLLSKKFALVVEHGMDTLHAPYALGGVLVAVLVLAPEGLAALRAAYSDRLQRSINICLGSALATIGLTVPAVLTIGLFTGHEIELGLGDTGLVLLVLTLVMSVLTFGGTRTNMMLGAVHLAVFIIYVVLIFSP